MSNEPIKYTPVLIVKLIVVLITDLACLAGAAVCAIYDHPWLCVAFLLSAYSVSNVVNTCSEKVRGEPKKKEPEYNTEWDSEYSHCNNPKPKEQDKQ